ncbi:MAG TPA: alanine racemase [Mesorhizobium sp.]|jgi:D-serine deaminase-like pyridoxal phosphate-dependent protein|uniref:alanine racemase n=1 Tax=Mesorhizobium sp. TaxID=1871066 RepID=UPI002DDD09FC|nr:alanine racemase [Mesorhizobium sp.]HEV2504302.1 alanine racemase [Mesorhizobium sp.]
MDGYFQTMTAALREAGLFKPCLVLDRDRLDGNISLTRQKLAPELAPRLVDKSLACLPLLSRIAEALGSSRFMTFHLPISEAVLKVFPEADLLFGKPMPIEAARQVLARKDDDWRRVCWLIDTEARLEQYRAMAEALGCELRIAFEVDIGLHRGGIAEPKALSQALQRVRQHPLLHCEGIMGYEAHAPHIPNLFGGAEKALAQSVAAFQAFVACLGPGERQILNTGGSKTALLHGARTQANEVSIGSAFVLPSDFDTAGLAGFRPAAFIATPVLKVVEAQLPGPALVGRALQMLGRFPPRGCYIYGGKWMAKPVFPEGAREEATLGQSSNQQFMALPADATLQPDDFFFLRPTQSEFVLQQFGTIAVFSQGHIIEQWSVLPVG